MSGFERHASTYDAVAEPQLRLAAGLEAWLPRCTKPRLALDLGCGTGRLWPQLARAGLEEIWAVDRAPAMLRQAELRAAESGLVFRGICSELEHLELDYAPEKFDLIYSSAAVQWLSDPAALIARSKAWMKPGASWLLGSFGPKNLQELRRCFLETTGEALEVGVRYSSREQMAAWFQAAGFEQVETEELELKVTSQSARSFLRELRQMGVTGSSSRRLSLGETRQLCRRLEESCATVERSSPGSSVLTTWHLLRGRAVCPGLS